MASSSAIGTVTSRKAGRMYEKSVRIWVIGTPRLTTISTSLRTRMISRIEVNTASPNTNGTSSSRRM
jgi:hypothetical protein